MAEGCEICIVAVAVHHRDFFRPAYWPTGNSRGPHRSGKHNGYIHSAGTAEARAAVAAWSSAPGSVLTEEDVVITSGCSGALDLAITCLANPGAWPCGYTPIVSVINSIAFCCGRTKLSHQLRPPHSPILTVHRR